MNSRPVSLQDKKSKLLMIWSSFGDKHYAIGLAASKSGNITGPWRQLPDPLFDANGGHGMILETFDGKLMLLFHQPNSSPREKATLFQLYDKGDRLVLKTIARFQNSKRLRYSGP